MWPLLPGHWIAFICLASVLPYAHFVKPTLLRRAKVVHVILDETRSLSRLPQRYQVEEQWRHACCLAHIVREVTFSVVANRAQSHKTGENPPWRAGAYSFVACLVVQPLTMHPRSPIFLIVTPQTFGRSWRILFKLHIDCLPILFWSCFAVCGYNLSLRIAIVSPPHPSLRNCKMSHTSSFVMPPPNTFLLSSVHFISPYYVSPTI